MKCVSALRMRIRTRVDDEDCGERYLIWPSSCTIFIFCVLFCIPILFNLLEICLPYREFVFSK